MFECVWSAGIVWKARLLVCELELVLIVVILFVVVIVILCCFFISIVFGWNSDDDCYNSNESVLVLNGVPIEIIKVLDPAFFSGF